MSLSKTSRGSVFAGQEAEPRPKLYGPRLRPGSGNPETKGVIPDVQTTTESQLRRHITTNKEAIVLFGAITCFIVGLAAWALDAKGVITLESQSTPWILFTISAIALGLHLVTRPRAPVV